MKKDENRWTWTKVDENWWKWMKVDENGWTWMKMDENGWKWMKVGGNGWKWMKVDESGWKWMEVDESGCKWMKVDESGWTSLWCRFFVPLSSYILLSLSWFQSAVQMSSWKQPQNGFAISSFLDLLNHNKFFFINLNRCSPVILR